MSSASHDVQLTGSSAESAISTARPIVLLHGWGMGNAIWQPLLPVLQNIAPVQCLALPGYAADVGGNDAAAYQDLEYLLQTLLQQMPSQAIVMGYSLGGMLAMQLAQRFPQHIAAVITLASNQRFVASDDYPMAMAAENFAHFQQGLQTQPDKTLKRFMALQVRGAEASKTLLKEISALATQAPPDDVLKASLELLAQLDNRQVCSDLALPQLHLLAANDALVNVSVAPLLARNSRAEVHVLPSSSHLLHWQRSQDIAELIQGFLAKLDTAVALPVRNKQDVQRSFSQAARSYDAAADLQRGVAEQLFSLASDWHTCEVVLDLGCGTGYCSDQLARAGVKQVLAVDFAPAMLDYARQQYPLDAIAWHLADAENLPFQAASVDRMYSSLAIQWSENLPAVFAEAFRVLKPGGKFIFSTFGPDSLMELRQAWAAVDNYVHVNAFHPWQSLQQAAEAVGFAGWQLQAEQRQEFFTTVMDLSRSLKAIGAHNVNRGRPQGMTGRRHLQRLAEAYELFRDGQQRLPLSYQVYYVVVNKPD